MASLNALLFAGIQLLDSMPAYLEMDTVFDMNAIRNSTQFLSSLLVIRSTNLTYAASVQRGPIHSGLRGNRHGLTPLSHQPLSLRRFEYDFELHATFCTKPRNEFEMASILSNTGTSSASHRSLPLLPL
jgi:hypothetical protein